VNVKRTLPRFVIAKTLKNGSIAFYWTLPSYFRKLGCTLHKEHETALGTDYETACGEQGKAGVLNGLFDEWDRRRLGGAESPIAERLAPFGTVDWLFRTYKASNDWAAKVSARTAPDHELTMKLLCDIRTKKGDRIGDRFIRSISPVSADKLYAIVRDTPSRKGKTSRPRTAAKVVAIARHAWKVVHRLHPTLFDEKVPNPWIGVAMKRRQMATKPAATREEVYTFAWGAMEAGHPDAAAAAIICFEWLQRPENVLAGYVRWGDYRGAQAQTAIRIEHHKTGAMVLHPLEDVVRGERVLFYAEAEEILSKVPRLGLGIVMRQRAGGSTKWDIMSMGRLVRNLRGALGLPDTFTLDACRHGGMTELEEAELTDGQGRALSAHRSKAYEGYAKRTEKRALAATRKRHAHRLAIDAQQEPSRDTPNSEKDEKSLQIKG
jgi:hypothetical protein